VGFCPISDGKVPVSPRKILAVLVIILAGYCIYSFIPPSEKLKKGLDIQGGVHLRMEVDKDKLGTNPSVKEVAAVV